MALPTTATAASRQLPSGAQATPPAPASSSFLPASIASSPSFNGSIDASNGGVSPAPQLAVVSTASDASTKPPKKRKGAGKRLMDRERVEILDLIESSSGSLTNAEIARRYGVTRAAIQKLKLKGPEVRARYRYGSAETRDDRKRGGHVMNVPFEKELYEWVRGLKARKVPVPPSLVKEKAKLLVPKYGLGNFQASNGWYYNFCRRFNLIASLVEEKAAVPEPETEIAEEDTSLEVDPSPPLQQMTATAQPTTSVYEQQLQSNLQQYQQQMAAIAAATLQEQLEQEIQKKQQQLQQEQRQQQQEQSRQQQEQAQQQRQPEERTTQAAQSNCDRMLMLLEQQNTLLERQNSMIEDQASTIKKLYEVVTRKAAL